MLLKVLYILLGYMLVDGFFWKTNGENVTLKFETKADDSPNGGVNQLCTNYFNGVNLSGDNITVHEGDRMDIIFTNRNYMNIVQCWVESSQGRYKLLDLRNSKKVSSNNPYEKSEHPIDSISNSVAGSWYCSVYTLNYKIPNSRQAEINGSYYLQNNCTVNVFVQPRTKNDVPSAPFEYFWIYIAVAVVVAVIIISQTGVILYLKSKAKRTPRLDSLSLRTHNRDEKDTKRYSQPPGVKKSRFSRMLRRSTNKDEETIYETLEELRNVGEQTPPVPPIETIPTLKKKKNSQSQGSPDVMSKSLPRPEKARPAFPTSNTMHRIPERGPSPDLDISRRPPLPLPAEQPEERSATPSRAQRAFAPIEEGGQSTPNTLIRPRPGIGQASVASELDSILKMRKASLATPSVKNWPPAPPKKHSFPSLRRKLNMEASSDVDNSGRGKFVPETPNPLPTGKSAILLGLAPGTAPKPKPKTNAIKQPPNPTPPKLFGTSVPPKPFKNSSPLNPAVTPQPPLKTPIASKKPAAAVTSVKPPASSVMLPRPPMALAPNKAPIKPPTSIVPLIPSMPPAKPPGATFKPHVAHKIPPVKPMIPNPQHPKFERPAPQLAEPTARKPPYWPPANEATQEDIYEETEEPVYNEEWTPPNPQPSRFEKPTPPLPPSSIGKPPPLPPANKPTQEDVYEEYLDEPVYNSDDEWTYEPLQQYNIYSS